MPRLLEEKQCASCQIIYVGINKNFLNGNNKNCIKCIYSCDSKKRQGCKMCPGTNYGVKKNLKLFDFDGCNSCYNKYKDSYIEMYNRIKSNFMDSFEGQDLLTQNETKHRVPSVLIRN